MTYRACRKLAQVGTLGRSEGDQTGNDSEDEQLHGEDRMVRWVNDVMTMNQTQLSAEMKNVDDDDDDDEE